MTAVILFIVAILFLVCLILIIREFLPSDTAQNVKNFTEGRVLSYKKVVQKGHQYTEKSDKTLTGLKAVIEVINLPEIWKKRINNVLFKMSYSVNQVNEFANEEDIFSFLAMISPHSAKIYGGTSDNYTFVITEDENDPFQINEEIMNLAQKIVAGKVYEIDKAQALFDWCVNNIPYGTSGWKKHQKSMRTAVEIFEDKEGVCAEMTILYIVMARAVGLKANYSKVEEVDKNGQLKKHASPVVLIAGRHIYPDIAYKVFDARHNDYKIMTDQEAVPHFKSLRGN
jgi:hypothetical protein